MIVNLSLFIISACFLFIIFSKHIHVDTAAKGIICIMFISIIGITVSLNTGYKQYTDPSFKLFFSSLAVLVCFVTYKIKQRGGLV